MINCTSLRVTAEHKEVTLYLGQRETWMIVEKKIHYFYCLRRNLEFQKKELFEITSTMNLQQLHLTRSKSHHYHFAYSCNFASHFLFNPMCKSMSVAYAQNPLIHLYVGKVSAFNLKEKGGARYSSSNSTS